MWDSGQMSTMGLYGIKNNCKRHKNVDLQSSHQLLGVDTPRYVGQRTELNSFL